MIHTIGMLIPATNSAIEVEANRVLPDNYQVHVGRLRISAVDEAGWAEQDADIDYQAQLLGTINPAVIILLQTSASLYGENYDAEVTRRMAAHSGAPAVTSAQAMGRALVALDAGRVAIISPYSHDLIARAKAYLEADHGLDVVMTEGFNMTDPQAIGRLGPDAALPAFERAAASTADAIVLAGGAFRALASIEEWEQRFGKPVITTNQVAMWAGVQTVGGNERIRGYGRLLEAMPAG